MSIFQQPGYPENNNPYQSDSSLSLSQNSSKILIGCGVLLVIMVVIFCLFSLLSSGNSSSGILAGATAAIAVPILLCACAIPVVCWLYPLIDCLQNEPSDSNDKLVWVLLILFLGGIGGIFYLILRRPDRIRMYGR
jgi:di/tricarboxylate transporter